MKEDAKTILVGLATIAPWFAVLCAIKLICEVMR